MNNQIFVRACILIWRKFTWVLEVRNLNWLIAQTSVRALRDGWNAYFRLFHFWYCDGAKRTIVALLLCRVWVALALVFMWIESDEGLVVKGLPSPLIEVICSLNISAHELVLVGAALSTVLVLLKCLRHAKIILGEIFAVSLITHLLVVSLWELSRTIKHFVR